MSNERIKAWSYSRLVDFEQCKLRAKLKYIDRIPEPARPLPPGKTEHANDRGTRIHDAGERFVQVLEPGKLPATKHVSGSNNCHIGLVVDEDAGQLIAISAIDNLVKGLAGAAVQCMNLMCGYEESTGLQQYPLWP